MNRKLVIGLGSAASAGFIALLMLFFARDPAAATPSGVTVSAIMQKGGSWTTVGADPSGAFDVLPGGLPSGGILLYFYAPSRTALRVDIDGTALPLFSSLAAGADPSVSGYYRVNDLNTSRSPAIWTVGVRPPAAKLALPMFTLNIADVSLNPFLSGTARQSAPLSIKLVAQQSYVVAVVLSGSGQGTITSNPAGISCPPTCSFDFGQSVNVSLTPQPSSSSTFDGWSGPCSGYGNCPLLLNGTAFTADAAFRLTTLTGNPMVSSCPAMNPPPNSSWFSEPFCSSQNAFNDPSPDLSCNSQKYFCCAKVLGAAGGDCPPDHVEYPASCDFGNPNVIDTASGCYLKN